MGIFEDKTILITGASSGIGKSCAIRLASAGATLILIGRDKDVLNNVIPGYAPRCYQCDISDEAEVETLVTELKQNVGTIDGWVLAAGTHDLRPLSIESTQTTEYLFSVNYHGSIGLIGKALKKRVIAKGGAIVFLSSSVARTGSAAMVSYSASKGAIESATKSLAAELASQKIRVNAVAPGVVQTPMSESYLNKFREEQVQHLEKQHLFGFGRPENISGPIEFLLSNDASWITGTILTVDGGFSVG